MKYVRKNFIVCVTLRFNEESMLLPFSYRLRRYEYYDTLWHENNVFFNLFSGLLNDIYY